MAAASSSAAGSAASSNNVAAIDNPSDCEIQATTVFTLMFHLCSAQVFPFSNLRAFFDKNKQGRDAVGISSSGTNVSRPHRQANHDAHLPALPEFDSPDIFTINKDIEDERGTTVKRHPSSPDTSSGRKGIGRHRINTKLNVGQPHEDSDGAIFITPKPNSEYTEYGSSAEDYSKIRSKNRIRKRKPQTVQVEPDVQHSHHVPSDKRLSGFQHSGNPVQPSPETSFTSDGTYVESIPSLAIAIEDDFQKPKVNNGLVDYLVPPKHPSVYEKALKLSKTRKPHSPGVAKLKSPAPTGLSKKESRFRPKKHREQNVPLTERTIKRQAPRRRPAHPREPQRKPVRKPPVESVATQMDEQITSETGFTVVGALHGGGAGAGSHGDERVEFQMHGQKGPHSYKFGYDTGKGHNRQFRFEEKDNHGRVKGHYGYYDKDGKLQIVNYEADPHTGFKAETV